MYELACFPPEHTGYKNAILQKFFFLQRELFHFSSLFLTEFTLCWCKIWREKEGTQKPFQRNFGRPVQNKDVGPLPKNLWRILRQCGTLLSVGSSWAWGPVQVHRSHWWSLLWPPSYPTCLMGNVTAVWALEAPTDWKQLFALHNNTRS